MNYRIMPFSNIVRSTGVRAVLKNELVLAIPNAAAPTYKWRNAASTSDRVDNLFTHPEPLRHRINLDETVKGFEARFDRNGVSDVFRSATEICDIHLVPQTANATYSQMEGGSFWPNYRLTGDSSRERPYATIYPRFTTKSNTFQVHYRVQSLTKAPGAADVWVEGRDRVESEIRGSTILERYVDPGDVNIPDFALPENADLNLDANYRFRVVSQKQFLP